MKAFVDSQKRNFLKTLVGKPLIYALKSPDTELYDFGFGKLTKILDRCGNQQIIATHTLHVLCRFKVIPQERSGETEIFYENTPCEFFNCKIKKLIDINIKRVALSNKNDLWLDFGDYWMVFATYENAEESWRFFTSDNKCAHLVASNCWLDYQ